MNPFPQLRRIPSSLHAPNQSSHNYTYPKEFPAGFVRVELNPGDQWLKPDR
jgi:hypothetical protein